MAYDSVRDQTNMVALRTRVNDVGDRIRKLQQEVQLIVDACDLLWIDLCEEFGDAPIKRADGRLSEAGIQAVNAAFTAGSKNSEIAKMFDITPGAASQRRTSWLAQKCRVPEDGKPGGETNRD